MTTQPKQRLQKQKLNLSRPVALRLTDSERTQASRLASIDGRSTAGFARQMYLRGLRAYLAESVQATVAA